jgi:hypothetical protein
LAADHALQWCRDHVTARARPRKCRLRHLSPRPCRGGRSVATSQHYRLPADRRLPAMTRPARTQPMRAKLSGQSGGQRHHGLGPDGAGSGAARACRPAQEYGQRQRRASPPRRRHAPPRQKETNTAFSTASPSRLVGSLPASVPDVPATRLFSPADYGRCRPAMELNGARFLQSDTEALEIDVSVNNLLTTLIRPKSNTKTCYYNKSVPNVPMGRAFGGVTSPGFSEARNDRLQQSARPIWQPE